MSDISYLDKKDADYIRLNSDVIGFKHLVVEVHRKRRIYRYRSSEDKNEEWKYTRTFKFS